MKCAVTDLQQVASKIETVIDTTHPSRDDSATDDDSSAELLTNYTLPSYDPDLRLSSSLGHLQLECVREDSTELEEAVEVDIVADEVKDGKETLDSAVAVNESSTDAAAAAPSDDGLQQPATASGPQTDAAETPLHAESKLFRYLVQLSASYC